MAILLTDILEGIVGVGTVVNDTSTNSDDFYITMAQDQTSGTYRNVIVSSSRLYFNPSSGTLTATGNLKIGTTSQGIIFPDDTFQNTAATSTAAAGGTGAIQYASGTAFAGDNTTLYFNGTDKIGIGTNDVTNAGFHAKSSLPALFDTTSGDDRQLRVGNSATTAATLGYDPIAVSGYLRANPTGTSMITWSATGVGINGISVPVNALDIAGGAVIGSGFAYAGTATAPADGLLIQGAVGLGTTSAGTNVKLGIYGGNLVVGSSSYGIVFPDGTFQSTAAGAGGVTSFSAGSTGLTPSTATTGDITLGGTLSVSNGGTGGTTLTTNGVLYGNGTSTVQATAQGGSNVILVANDGAPSFSSSPTIGTSVTTPLIIGGTAASSTLTLRSTSGAGSTDAIIFNTGSQAERMRIASGGNVGIGTNLPSTALHVLGNQGITSQINSASVVSAISLDNNNIGTTNGVGIQFRLWSTFGAAINVGSINTIATAKEAFAVTPAMQFTVNGAERMRIGDSGNVGIGTTTTLSTTRLAVFGGNVQIGSTGNGIVFSDGTFMNTAAAGGSSVSVTDDTTTNANTFYPSLTNNVTSGTLSGLTTSSTKLYFNPSSGTLNATIFNSVSDINMKTDITAINDSDTIMDALRGVRFRWRDTGAASAGLIAQDVESVMPELINTTEHGKSLNYNGIIGVLVEAIRDLKQEVAVLRSRMDA